MAWMTESEARRSIVKIGKQMHAAGYVAANDGNISVRIAEDEIIATPTGVSKAEMDEVMMLRMRISDGAILAKGDLNPSTEIRMHLRVYRENPSVNAVCHAHPPVSTSFACAGLPLDRAVYPEAFLSLGIVPCAPYAMPGTEDVPDSIAPYCRDYHAVLLANHGVVTWGTSLTEAWFRLESVEHYATILLNLRILGRESLLTRQEVNDLISFKEAHQMKIGGIPLCQEDMDLSAGD